MWGFKLVIVFRHFGHFFSGLIRIISGFVRIKPEVLITGLAKIFTGSSTWISFPGLKSIVFFFKLIFPSICTQIGFKLMLVIAFFESLSETQLFDKWFQTKWNKIFTPKSWDWYTLYEVSNIVFRLSFGFQFNTFINIKLKYFKTFEDFEFFH